MERSRKIKRRPQEANLSYLLVNLTIVQILTLFSVFKLFQMVYSDCGRIDLLKFYH